MHARAAGTPRRGAPGAGCRVALLTAMLRHTQTPQLPKIMELVGLGYSSWFVYRYLLFKARRPSRATAPRHTQRRCSVSLLTAPLLLPRRRAARSWWPTWRS